MNKQIFLEIITQELKALGYKKNKNYWYKENNGYLMCINLQGSQWNKADYYVEFGISLPDTNIKYPTVYQWFCRHRCIGRAGDKNILPEDLLIFLSAAQRDYPDVTRIAEYIINQSKAKVTNQYWF